MTEPRCGAHVYRGGWDVRRCSRKGVVKESEQHWCKQHAPSAVAARDAARTERWAAESRERARQHREQVLQARKAAAYDGLIEALERIRNATGDRTMRLGRVQGIARAALARAEKVVGDV